MLPENKLTRVFQRKHHDEGQDPLELYMSVIETCFDQEDSTCHFESTLEYNVLGDHRYSCRLYFEIPAHNREFFDEELFRESLLNNGSIREKLMFLPLNLVFKLTDNVTRQGKDHAPTGIQIQKTLELRPSIKEFAYLKYPTYYELVGVMVRTHRGANKAFTLLGGEWKTNYQGRLLNCKGCPQFNKEGTIYMLLYKMLKNH